MQTSSKAAEGGRAFFVNTNTPTTTNSPPSHCLDLETPYLRRRYSQTVLAHRALSKHRVSSFLHSYIGAIYDLCPELLSRATYVYLLQPIKIAK